MEGKSRIGRSGRKQESGNEAGEGVEGSGMEGKGRLGQSRRKRTKEREWATGRIGVAETEGGNAI